MLAYRVYYFIVLKTYEMPTYAARFLYQPCRGDTLSSKCKSVLLGISRLVVRGKKKMQSMCAVM